MANAKENEQFVKALLPAWPLDDAIDWIEKNMDPEEVFGKERLETWAKDNGFTQAT